jgi:cell division protein ZapE
VTEPSLVNRYQQELAQPGFSPDAAQLAAVEKLEALRIRLIEAKPARGLLSRLSARTTTPAPRGLYLWGGVGRGKTWLMDLFFASLPFKQKQRSHFHRFMQWVHAELKKHSGESDPLLHIATQLARKTRVVCFDEFFVSDIADAMLLGKLFEYLFEQGITLVATSNVAPDNLYKDGLQRARFLPAIALLKEHTEVLRVDGGTDYRLRVLTSASTWLVQDRAGAKDSQLEKLFAGIAGDAGEEGSTLTVNSRRLRPRRAYDGAVWFEFTEICEGPRSASDYIELAHCYHTVFVSDLPVLDVQMENAARRFISLVDEFYDHNVKLIVTAATAAMEIYQGTKLQFEFARTSSRLTEMQSEEYLARPHHP